jgi:hypothetical protein
MPAGTVDIYHKKTSRGVLPRITQERFVVICLTLSNLHQVLLQILSSADAAFYPLREEDWRTLRPTNAYLARKQFQEHGLVYRTLLGDDRYVRERALEQAQDENLVTVTRLPRHKFPLAKLTDTGEDMARGLADLPTFRISLIMLERVRCIATDEGLADGWVSETKLGAVHEDRPHWAIAITEFMLPVLLRGLAESTSDIKGHVRYRVTPSGVLALDAALTDQLPDLDADRHQENQEAMDFYCVELAFHENNLCTVQSASAREIGLIPHPCGVP